MIKLVMNGWRPELGKKALSDQQLSKYIELFQAGKLTDEQRHNLCLDLVRRRTLGEQIEVKIATTVQPRTA